MCKHDAGFAYLHTGENDILRCRNKSESLNVKLNAGKITHDYTRDASQRCKVTFQFVAYLSQFQDPPSRWGRLRTVPSGAWRCHPGRTAGGWTEERQREGLSTRNRKWSKRSDVTAGCLCLWGMFDCFGQVGHSRWWCTGKTNLPVKGVINLHGVCSHAGREMGKVQLSARRLFVPVTRARHSGSQHGWDVLDNSQSYRLTFSKTKALPEVSEQDG